MKVTCYLNKKEIFQLDWDEMPNIGMGFYHKKREYIITNIKYSKITIKDITKIKVS